MGFLGSLQILRLASAVVVAVVFGCCGWKWEENDGDGDQVG